MCSRQTIIRNVYVSTRQRNIVKFPSASDFTIDLPIVLKNIYGVVIRSFKYTPEPLIHNGNRTFTFVANSGTVTGTLSLNKGDYSQDITTLLTEVNSYINAYDMQFSIDATTQRVQLSFAGPFVTNYFAIPYCPLLQLFGYTTGICLYRTGQAPVSLPSATAGFDTIALAPNGSRVINDTDMVIRITDVEAIFSQDSVTNRATAILMSSRSPLSVTEILPNDFYHLMQVQSRLQQLRVRILNSNGDLYDLQDEDASFLIQFYCYID